jgi:hypothetical protein
MFLIVWYHSIVKQYSIEKIFAFSKSLTLKNNDVQSITLCEYVHIYLFTNWTCNVWWFHSRLSLFFLPHTIWNMRRESNRFVVTLPFSFSISSHLIFIPFNSFRMIWWEALETAQSYISKYYSIMHGIAIELKEITGGIVVIKERWIPIDNLLLFTTFEYWHMKEKREK